MTTKFEVRTGNDEIVATVDTWWQGSRLVTAWQDRMLQAAWIKAIAVDQESDSWVV